MSFDFEFAVVGAGGMGSAAAYYLAREGKSVVVIEQFEIGHIRGASHGENRIIRYSYEYQDYVKLAKESYRLWAEASAEIELPLLTTTAGLDLGYPENGDFDKCIEMLTLENVDHEILDRREINNRFPQFNVEENVRGVYQKDAGYLEPDVCVPAFLRLAQNHGAVIKDNTVLDGINITDDFVDIQTDKEKIRVKKIILALGPWASPMIEKLTGINIPISVTFEQYSFFTPKHPEQFEENKFPVFIVYVNPGEENLYGFPFFGDLGVKVAEHRAGAVTEAATRTFTPDPDKIARLTKRAQKLFPDLTTEITKTGTCLYSNTPDRHFIIDKLPRHDNVIVAAGFSGHGFKFVPLVGSILKDLAINGQTAQPIGMFQIQRFASASVRE
ncbi:MAG: N-methyl-L-tryptophan oxidase [Candidatus Melainabacteria bacterium]|nr:N-methyl-L-tryptophan oxidase [Candidatus Melainabacteria bacterium]